jgi:hypothetical protein
MEYVVENIFLVSSLRVMIMCHYALPTTRWEVIKKVAKLKGWQGQLAQQHSRVRLISVASSGG